MWRRIAHIVGGLLLVLGALSAVFLVGMRTKYTPVVTRVRRFNRAVTNPQAMKTAGQPGAMAASIEHVGRTSGTIYRTPIGPVVADDGFVIPLPYGLSPDWLKNVIAAGSAIIVYEGVTYSVSDPKIIPSSAALDYVPAAEQRALRAFAVDQFLRLRREDSEEVHEPIVDSP